jgi:hypothetical protein
MENKKTLWIVLGIVLVVIIVFWAMSSSTPAPEYPPVAQDNTTVTPPPESTQDTTTGSINTGGAAASLSYAQALVKYKNARIQIDENCQANAQSQKMQFKNNASVMIDNRAPVARTIHLGSIFPIKAYGFKIIKLYSATLPATLLMDCDKIQNVSTVLIQK